MGKRRTADQIVRLLRDADRDLAKGLTVADVCRKFGIAENTYYRWRQRHAPDQADDARRVRALEAEVERLKKIVVELMLDRQMLQDVAKKSGDADPATCRRGLLVSALRRRAAAGLPGVGAGTLDHPSAGGRAGPGRGFD